MSASAYPPAIRSSSMTPTPPCSSWSWRAGNGFQMSKRRNSRNAVTSTGMVRGRKSTEASMPATSSITMMPGSLASSARSTREPAQIPARVTTTSASARASGDKGMSQRAMTVTKLPTVPDATGEYPAPPTVATPRARRSTGPSLLALADQLVAVDLGDRHVGEAPRREPAVTQQHDPVDLGRLAGQPPLEGKRAVRARPVHQHGLPRAEQRFQARPGEPVLGLLDDRGTLGHDIIGHLVRQARRRCALFDGVGEDAEAVERDVLHEGQEIVEGALGLSGKADEDSGADSDARARVAKRGDDVLQPARGDRSAHRLEHVVVAVLDGHVEVRQHPCLPPLDEQALADVRGVEIHGPDPRHRRVGQGEQEVADVSVAGQVAAVGERVLRDEDRLPDPARGEPLDLGDDVLPRPAPMLAAELRDRA